MNQIQAIQRKNDMKWAFTILDNPDSYIHEDAFSPLKETLIRNITSTTSLDLPIFLE